ncbi:hypothetical protein BCV72DRAFT_302767 [Rhizopus microsporus var. microsporus]|uniref:Uncharacterized protein n=2 Tax=Rhizopus microsporus TaxID=58291 RepID=A0A2G4SKT8_RHIZD|nr:uncharacterized protein RHIMIDRAFT_240884 [Rhizopus microsporus ATCC 52813]ORE09534.1 hypothetical protein BCV72DRAFT_302767 [Rhizopus microsporus var. microsporus]PHZ09379.1 hypothetical protein RHIMIDRAFT_240884 [Rhizopus microsporus ATCC 52813]
MSEKFWSYRYRAVARGEGHISRSNFIECIRNCFDIFDICRKNPNNGQYLYDISVLDALHGYLASSYTTSVVTNVGLHLARNVRRNTFVVFKGFFLGYQTQIRSSISVSNIAKLAINSIINRTPTFECSMPPLPVAHELYEIVYNIFYGAFRDLPFEVISSFEFAFENASKLLCFSATLLREATNFRGLRFEFRTWSLLPIAKARNGDNYHEESKEVLWEHVFNIDHLQKNRQRKQNSLNTNNEKNKIALDYGISSDGHMVPALFSVKTIERLSETKIDEQHAPNSVDISR